MDSVVSPPERRAAIIQLILSHPNCANIDVNAVAGGRGTALLGAIKSRAHHENIICLLNDPRVDVEVVDCESRTILHAVAMSSPDWISFHGVRVVQKLLQRKACDAVSLCQDWQHACYPLRRSLPDEMILKIISFVTPSPATWMQITDELGKTPLEAACETSQSVPEDNTEFLRGVNQVCGLYQKFEHDWMSFLPGRHNASDEFVFVC